MIQAIRLPSAQSPFSERRTEQIQNTWLKVSCRNEWRLLVKSLGTRDLNEQALRRFCGRYSSGKFESNSPSLANHSIEARTHWTSAWSPFDKSGSRFFSAWSSSLSKSSARGFSPLFSNSSRYARAKATVPLSDANAHARKASMTNPPLLMSCPPKEASSSQ